MQRAGGLVVRDQQDQPLHLSPAAEMADISKIAAALGARGGLRRGVVAVEANQLVGAVIGRPVGKGGVGVDNRLLPMARAPPSSFVPSRPRGFHPRGAAGQYGEPAVHHILIRHAVPYRVPQRDRLALRRARWQRRRMSQSPPPRAPRAAGSILALAIIAGALIGAGIGQSSAGLMIGAGIGVSIAILYWLVDRRR